MEIQASQQLAANQCKPCEGGVSAWAPDDANAQLEQLVGWRITHDGMRIRKEWTVKNFMAALEFFTRVAEVSENEGHHPDLHLEGYRKRLDRTLDPRHRRPERERLHPGSEDRSATGGTGNNPEVTFGCTLATAK